MLVLSYLILGSVFQLLTAMNIFQAALQSCRGSTCGQILLQTAATLHPRLPEATQL